MGNFHFISKSVSFTSDDEYFMNIHRKADPSVIIHTVIDSDFDCDHSKARCLPVGLVCDGQILAELARREVRAEHRTSKPFTTISEVDLDHENAMRFPLGTAPNELLLSEIARRNLDIRDEITEDSVKVVYELTEVLGRGSSGHVVLANHKISNKKYACKIVKRDPDMNDIQSINTELEIMKRIRYPHILQLIELFETPSCIWMIIELAGGGDLWRYCVEHDSYTEATVARLLTQILMGIHYLHSVGVVHRDIKFENILLSDKSRDADIKITDFGSSVLIQLGEHYNPSTAGSTKRKEYQGLHDMWGTKQYFAPEVIWQAYGPQVDIWALGCLFYEMLCGARAFPLRAGQTDHVLYERIVDGAFDRQSLRHVSAEARDLIFHMLEVDPVKRYSAEEALLHPFITEARSAELNLSARPLRDAQESLRRRLEARQQAMSKQESLETGSSDLPAISTPIS